LNSIKLIESIKINRKLILNRLISSKFLKINKLFVCSLNLDGHVVVFPFDKNSPNGPLCDVVNYEADCSESSFGHDSHGIKGRSALRDLSCFNPIMNTNIDYMHSILEGVMKRFFKIWFEDNVEDNQSLKCHMDEINSRLLKIRPPSFVPNAPREIYLWRLWRAHEF
jgi:hypothetical protein